MSDSVRTLREQARARRDKELERFQRISRLLDALPAASPAPCDAQPFGYCANAGLEFPLGTEVPALLELYPPLDAVLVHGSTVTVKPVKYLRPDDEMAAQAPVHPVVVRVPAPRQFETRWWTSLAGQDVEIRVHADRAYEPPNLGRCLADHYGPAGASTVFYRRRLAEPAVRPCAFVRWDSQWRAFATDQELRAAQHAVLMAWRARVELGEGPWTEAWLPAPHYARGGTALRVPTDRELPEYALEQLANEAARPAHPFDRMTDFWRVFTREQALAVLAFVNAMVAQWQQTLADAQVEQAAVGEWLTRFFHTPLGRFNEGDLETKRRFRHALRRDTGLDVQVAWLTSGRSSTQCRIVFGKPERFFERSFPVAPDAWPVRPQDIPVEYA